MSYIDEVSECLEGMLSNIYKDRGITSGDISLTQSLQWDKICEDASNLIDELVKQNDYSR